VKLLLIRHAIAVPAHARRRGRRASADLPRPQALPQGGAGAGPHHGSPDILLTSPLPRAAETAEIAAHAFGKLEPRHERALARGGTEAIINVLRRHPRDATVAIVVTSRRSRSSRAAAAVTAPSAWRSRKGRRAGRAPTEGRSRTARLVPKAGI